MGLLSLPPANFNKVFSSWLAESGSQSSLLTKPPGEIMTGLLLKYQYKGWMLKEQHPDN
jgi:hypothetical protein